MNRKQLIQTLVPMFYDINPTMPVRDRYNSYTIKHELEKGILPYPNRFYFSNPEVIEALVEMGIPHSTGTPNYYFAVKPKFPMCWITNVPPTEKPKYVFKRTWDAYLRMRKECDKRIEEILHDDTSTDSIYTKLAKKVGYH